MKVVTARFGFEQSIWLHEHSMFYVYLFNFCWICPLNILCSVFTRFSVLFCFILFLFLVFKICCRPSATDAACLSSSKKKNSYPFLSPLLAIGWDKPLNNCMLSGRKVSSAKLSRSAILQGEKSGPKLGGQGSPSRGGLTSAAALAVCLI